MGSASRDLDPADPRGWRLGGGVTYGTFALARLGLRVAALMGVDAAAATAWELEALRDGGADVTLVRLARGPVFTNDDRGPRRRQWCHEPGEPIPPAALPRSWRGAAGWLLAPIADELPGAWAAAPPAGSLVALGWQGLLRRLVPDRPVRRRAARPHPLLARADLVGVGSDELAPSLTLARLARWVGHDRRVSEVVLTAGRRGGLAVPIRAHRVGSCRLVPPISPTAAIDATGAGDVFLAVLLACRLCDTVADARTDRGLAVAAAAAGLSVERIGVSGAPTLAQVADRLGTARGSEVPV